VYAVTSHSSQGLTTERVVVNADTGVHPDLLNSRFGYVSISRASHEATLSPTTWQNLLPNLLPMTPKRLRWKYNRHRPSSWESERIEPAK
jgi:ATP-dependent exoDNAse (exonuclease V) alpha subunit